jgi:Spy/CpxP family protein refolding chaperone
MDSPGLAQLTVSGRFTDLYPGFVIPERRPPTLTLPAAIRPRGPPQEQEPMNDTTPVAPRKSWRKRLLQGAFLTSALAVGVAAVQLLPADIARAAAEAVHGDHDSMRERHRARMHDHMQRVLVDAGVGEAQRAKIDGIVKAAMDDQHADMERMHADMKLLKELLTAPTIDTAKVATVRAEQEQLALQAARRLADTALAVAQQLTPQQRQALGKELDRMFERHHGGRGFGPMHGGEPPRGD